MRLFISIILFLFFIACSSEEPKVNNQVLPPARLKAIVQQSKKNNAQHELNRGLVQNPIFIHRKKQKRNSQKPEIVLIITHNTQLDSIRLNKIEMLRASGIHADLSEPVNRGLLLDRNADTLLQSAISLGQDRVLQIALENDIFDYTDQFFTNGIRFTYAAPSLSDNPVKYILLPYWSRATNSYGLSLVQNLYTPSTTKKDGILYGDRPYSSYLFIGSFKITNDERHHYRQTSELDLGIIGPPSMGSAVQDLFHKYVPSNNEPLGWEYQVKTDAVVNYNFSLEKGVINTDHLQLILLGTGALGTLYTNIGGGFKLRLGWFNDYFSDLGIRKKSVLKSRGLKVNQYFFSIKSEARLIAYDATLEGGMINVSSPYTIAPSAVSRMITQTSVGLTLTFGGIGLELEQFVLSPEFSNKWWHAWGHIGLLFAL